MMRPDPWGIIISFFLRLCTGAGGEIPEQSKDAQLGQTGGGETSGPGAEDIQAEGPGRQEAP